MSERAWRCQPWADLSGQAVYDILRLRCEVFVVEQRCVYADVDGADPEAWHLSAWEGPALLAYARVFPPGVRDRAACVGRVVTAAAARGHGLGHELMARAIAWCEQQWAGAGIVLFAQAHLQAFYAGHGFEAVGAPFDEDGIPHIEMRRG